MTRGDIYLADLPQTSGSVQNGLRPVVVIQNDTGNTYSTTTIVACVTRKGKKPHQPTHISLDETHENVTGQILCEQLFTIAKSSLKKYIGKLNDSELAELNKAVSISLGLQHIGEKL